MEFSIAMANPIFIPEVFAKNGLKNPIQKTLQSGQDVQDMTWNVGAPLITMTPIADNGMAPKGQDFNGVLNALCDNTVHVQNGNKYQWSGDVVENYGGYKEGAIVQSDDGIREYRSLTNNNTTNPNNGIGQTWVVYAGVGSIPVATSSIAGVTKVINALNSNDVGSALSAAQGKALSDSKVSKTDIVNNLTSTNTDKPLSAAQGKAIADSFASLKTTNGYQKLQGGLILQWGSVDYSSYPGEVSVTVTFPLAFPTNCLNITTTRKMNIHSTNGDGGALIVSTSRLNAVVSLNPFNSDSVSNLRGFTWFAIGY